MDMSYEGCVEERRNQVSLAMSDHDGDIDLCCTQHDRFAFVVGLFRRKEDCSRLCDVGAPLTGPYSFPTQSTSREKPLVDKDSHLQR